MIKQSHISVHWESHKNNLSNGFAKLQQRQEFVDVTLAAGGHFVKAHQNVLALASPYFNEILKSIPCQQHPVIFLGPINHTVLALLLEYVYTGEVNVPNFILPSFIEASKLLHIVGIKDITVPEEHLNPRASTESYKAENVLTNISNEDQNQFNSMPTFNDEQVTQELIGKNSTVNEEVFAKHDENSSSVNIISDSGTLVNVQPLSINIIEPPDPEEIDLTENATTSSMYSDQLVENVQPAPYAACIRIDNESHEVSVQPLIEYSYEAVDYDGNQGDVNDLLINPSNTSQNETTSNKQTDCKTITDFEELISDTITDSENEFKVDVPTESGLLTISNIPNTKNYQDSTPCNIISGKISSALYAKSGRGNLQMIMNRFLYNLHHTSARQSKRRWRCIDYRRHNCRAYVDTINEDICGRKIMHSHPFHDNKILKLGRRQNLHTSIESALKK